jgi:ATP-dependent helicase/nuclease subunit A
MWDGFTPAQLSALDLDRNVAVLAGAGCGKTHVLSGRYVWTLLGAGVPAERILAITFTEKAAAEMRARIRRWLDREGIELERARIATIHAFSAALLREHALTADLDPAFAILDGAERIVLLREVIGGLLDALAAEPPPVARREEAIALRLLCRHHGRFGLEMILRGLVERRETCRAWAEATAQASDAELIARWHESVPGGRRLLLGLLEEAQVARALAGVAAARLRAGKKGSETISQIEAAIVRLRAGEDAGVEQLCDALFRAGGVPRGFGRDPAADAFDDLQRLLGPHYEELTTRIGPLDRSAAPLLRALARLVRATLRAYDAHKAERQVLDFDDLGEKAAALLAHQPDVRAAVREAHTHVLVDEVQDVSESQWNLIRWIVTQDDEGRVLRPSCLFAVGDEKQSIYRFRGADVSVFSRICEVVRVANQGRSGSPRLPGEGCAPLPTDGLISLDDNFRSHAAPLEFTNTLFARLFEPGGEAFCARPQSLRSCRAALGPAAPETTVPGVDLLVHVDPPGRAGDPASDGEDMLDFLALYGEADRVARYLRHTAGWQVPGQAGPCWRSCAVLLPMRTHLRSYEDALRRYRVPFVVLGGVGFYQTQEVVDAVSLFEFLADERRDIELAAVLRSPFAALSDGLLYAVARQPGASLWHKLVRAAAPDTTGLMGLCDAAEREAVRGVAQRIERWRRWRQRVPASELLARALEESGAYAGLLQGLRGPQRMANIGKLLDLVRGYEAGGFRALGDIAAALRILMEEEDREGEAMIAQAGVDAVRILTIHAAKGLEFPLVVVPELGARFRDSSERILVDELAGGLTEVALKVPDPEDAGKLKPTGLWRGLRARDRKKADAEMKRLLYVACTRARERLVLSATMRQTKDGSVPLGRRSWIGLLAQPGGIDVDRLADRARQAPGQRIETALGPASFGVVWGEGLPRERGPSAGIMRPPLSPEATAAALAAAQPVAAPHPRLRLTPTMAKDLDSCAHKLRLRLLTGLVEWAQAPAADDEPDESALELPGGPLVRGLLLHRALELGAYEAADPEPMIRRLAAEARVPDAAMVETVRDQVARFAVSPLGKRVRRARPSYAELPFVLELGESTLTGKIDRLARDGDEWLLLDWKTDDIAPTACTQRAAQAGYFAQMRLYARAAAELLGPDAPIRALLYFTAPGVVVEVPAQEDGFAALRVSDLLRGDLPVPAAEVCRACGYHRQRVCPADRTASPRRARGEVTFVRRA